ncbi:MAG: hypothetical protein P4M11_13790 [Candidatus Pacebacteria bacterium]|nr:hypothetical protein [Candidatus Paceibacterota bacterium]
MRKLKNEIAAKYGKRPDELELSMGTSDDYTDAVLELRDER